METRKGLITITPECLAELLGYPGSLVYRVQMDEDRSNYLINIMGAGPYRTNGTLPMVEEGTVVPTVPSVADQKWKG